MVRSESWEPEGVGSAGSSPWMTTVSWGKDIHPGVCTIIVIYCFFSHVGYQVQREGEETEENSGSSRTVFLLWLVPWFLWSSGSKP